jgi:hypothetical protein
MVKRQCLNAPVLKGDEGVDWQLLHESEEAWLVLHLKVE